MGDVDVKEYPAGQFVPQNQPGDFLGDVCRGFKRFMVAVDTDYEVYATKNSSNHLLYKVCNKLYKLNLVKDQVLLFYLALVYNCSVQLSVLCFLNHFKVTH